MSSYVSCPNCGFTDPSLDVDTLMCDECGFSPIQRITELETELTYRTTQLTNKANYVAELEAEVARYKMMTLSPEAEKLVNEYTKRYTRLKEENRLYAKHMDALPFLIEFIKSLHTPEAYKALRDWDGARGG